MEDTPSAKTWLGWAVTILGALALLAALLLGLWHLFVWLRDGIWPHLAAADMLAGLGIPPLALSWAWVQHAIDWVLSWSAAFLLTCLGLFLVILGTNLSADYDRKVAAARKARAEFAPASDAERAASWARGNAGAEAGPDLEESGKEDEDKAEKVSAPPRPPRTFWQGAVDNLLGCGCLILVIGGGFGLFVGWDYFDRVHYVRVSAHVLTVARSCVLESTGRYQTDFWGKRHRSDEMPCDQAEPQAPTSDRRVVEILTVTYTYTFPADGRTYAGTLHRDAVDFPADVRAGGEMPVYALKADPGRSRGLYPWPVD